MTPVAAQPGLPRSACGAGPRAGSAPAEFKPSPITDLADHIIRVAMKIHGVAGKHRSCDPDGGAVWSVDHRVRVALHDEPALRDVVRRAPSRRAMNPDRTEPNSRLLALRRRRPADRSALSATAIHPARTTPGHRASAGPRMPRVRAFTGLYGRPAWYPRWDSNPHWSDFKSPVSAIGLRGRARQAYCARTAALANPAGSRRTSRSDFRLMTMSPIRHRTGLITSTGYFDAATDCFSTTG